MLNSTRCLTLAQLNNINYSDSQNPGSIRSVNSLKDTMMLNSLHLWKLYKVIWKIQFRWCFESEGGCCTWPNISRPSICLW